MLSDHVGATVNKANSLVEFIRRSYKHLDGDSLVQLYKPSVKLLCFKAHLNKLENIQLG